MAGLEEESFRRRLYVDEKRFQMTIKQFLKWCQEDETNDSNMETRILLGIAAAESGIQKARMNDDMHYREAKTYEETFSKIEQSIKDTERDIERLTEELEREKIVRKNRQEYDALAKIIMEHPPRSETESRIVELEAELKQLGEQTVAIDDQMELRKKQFHYVMHALLDVQHTLNNEGKEENEDGSDKAVVVESMEVDGGSAKSK
eukprot:Colp12_sorted_trinity150504_noHs@32387